MLSPRSKLYLKFFTSKQSPLIFIRINILKKISIFHVIIITIFSFLFFFCFLNRPPFQRVGRISRLLWTFLLVSCVLCFAPCSAVPICWYESQGQNPHHWELGFSSDRICLSLALSLTSGLSPPISDTSCSSSKSSRSSWPSASVSEPSSSCSCSSLSGILISSSLFH